MGGRSWRDVSVAVVVMGVGAAASSCQSGVSRLAGARASASESILAMVRVRTGNPPVTDIIVTDTRGQHRKVLAGGAAARSGVRVALTRPAWSPDGRWLAFAGVVGRAHVHGMRAQQERTDLYLVRADGTGLHRLTHTGVAAEPVWSPDGRTIVFSALTRVAGSYPRVEARLLRVNSDGTHLRSLTHVVQGEVDVPGSFSPDGAQLAFTRAKVVGLAVESSIDVIRGDGLEPRELTANGGDPAYSPDGREIAFVSNRDHNGEIRTGEDESEYANELYVMDADGANPRRLTRTDEVSELAPSWSPDGSRIAYATQAEGFTKTLHVINADGSCGSQIAADPRRDVWYTEPAWRPVRARGGEGASRC